MNPLRSKVETVPTRGRPRLVIPQLRGASGRVTRQSTSRSTSARPVSEKHSAQPTANSTVMKLLENPRCHVSVKIHGPKVFMGEKNGVVVTVAPNRVTWGQVLEKLNCYVSNEGWIIEALRHRGPGVARAQMKDKIAEIIKQFNRVQAKRPFSVHVKWDRRRSVRGTEGSLVVVEDSYEVDEVEPEPEPVVPPQETVEAPKPNFLIAVPAELSRFYFDFSDNGGFQFRRLDLIRAFRAPDVDDLPPAPVRRGRQFAQPPVNNVQETRHPRIELRRMSVYDS